MNELNKWQIISRLFFGGDQSLSKAWEFLFQNVYISDDLRKKEKEIETLPAAKKVWHMERFAVDHAYKAMMTGGKSVFQMSKDELNEKHWTISQKMRGRYLLI